MYPEIHLGPLTLQTFGLMFALAFVTSGWIIAKRLKEFEAPVDWAYEMILAAAVGGILGAKLWYSMQEGDWSFDQVFSGSGLVWYGGALGGAAAVAIFAKWRDIFNLTMLDMAAPALAAGYAVGRIGCQLSGDGDYGKVTDAWWGMSYADGTVPTPPGVHAYPTPILETVSMAILAYVLWRFRNRWNPGILFGVYLVFSSLERFLVEFLRRNEIVAAGLTLAQIVSVALGLIGGAMILGLKDRPAAKADLLGREPSTT
jgi:phosphatidylglycerol:prolipoprotein diacylglycerol transferase